VSQQGLVQDCETLTGLGKNGIAGNSDRLKEFVRLLNSWYRKADTWIWKAAGDWDFDDSKNTTLPVATTALVDAQADYSLPSNARKVERVEVKDINGNYQLVSPMDKSQITGEAMTEFEETNGVPEYYDIVGNSLYLYPAPDATLTCTTSALKLYASRDIVAFTTTMNATTTHLEPGFDSHFHRILSLGASYDWCLSKGLTKADRIRIELGQLENEIKEFHGSRHRNMKTRFGVFDDSSI
jgi:hypothetical protein